MLCNGRYNEKNKPGQLKGDNVQMDLSQPKPIIAACDSKTLPTAIDSDAVAVIFMNASLGDIISRRFQEHCRRKPVFVHVDLLKGLNGDREALQFLKRHTPLHGIVSTKSNALRAAKKEGLVTIQRVFLIDTQSFCNSLESIAQNQPDYIEIMPAIAPSIVSQYRAHFQIPIILGGLVSTAEQIEEAFRCGAQAVSLSKKELWDYRCEG